MIHIKDDYYIDADPYQFILKRDQHKTDKEGRPMFDLVSYHQTFAQAVKSYCRMAQRQDIMDKPDRELCDAFFDFENLVRELEELLNSTEVK